MHPSQRGRGIWLRRQRWSEALDIDGRELVHMANATDPAMAAIRARGGMLPVGNQPRTLLRVQSPRGMASLHASWRGRRVPRAVAVAAFTLLRAARWPALPSRRRAATWTVRDADQIDERIETLCARAAEQFDMIQLHDRESFTWRYLDPRGGARPLALAEADGELLGYVVWKQVGPEGFLVDVLAVPDRLDVVRSLVAHALRALDAGGAASTSCWLPRRHPYRSELRRAGFIDTRRAAGLGFRQLRPDAGFDFLSDERTRIHFSFGDGIDV